MARQHGTPRLAPTERRKSIDRVYPTASIPLSYLPWFRIAFVIARRSSRTDVRHANIKYHWLDLAGASVSLLIVKSWFRGSGKVRQYHRTARSGVPSRRTRATGQVLRRHCAPSVRRHRRISFLCIQKTGGEKKKRRNKKRSWPSDLFAFSRVIGTTLFPGCTTAHFGKTARGDPRRWTFRWRPLGRRFVVAAPVSQIGPLRGRRGGRGGANGRDWIPSRRVAGITCTAPGAPRASRGKTWPPALSTWVPSLWRSWCGRSWYRRGRRRSRCPGWSPWRTRRRTEAGELWPGRRCSDRSRAARDRRAAFSTLGHPESASSRRSGSQICCTPRHHLLLD